MEDQDRKHMAAAIEQAVTAKQKGDVPFGAVIVRHNRIIVQASNSEHLDHNVTKHAELKAVSEASRFLGRRDLSDCTIYSTVEPCPMCAGAIFHACIARVVFAMSRDDLPTLFRTRKIRLWDLASDWHYKPEVVGGILSEEAIRIFLDYKQPFRVIPRRQITNQ
jgi:tRNA(adenine34) deaminase